MDEKRERAGDAEQRATERGARDTDGRLAPGDDGHGTGQLLRRHDGAERARLGRAEQGRSAPFDERDERDHPVVDLVGDDQQAQRPDDERSHRVSRDHEPPAAPVVCREPGRQREERHGEQPDERDEPRLRGGAVSASTSSGYAIEVICEPALERRSPVWSRRKSRFRRRGVAVTGRR